MQIDETFVLKIHVDKNKNTPLSQQKKKINKIKHQLYHKIMKISKKIKCPSFTLLI